MNQLAKDTVDPLYQAIINAYRADETQCVSDLLAMANLPSESVLRIMQQAQAWVSAIRNKRLSGHSLDAFLAEYDLSTEEGIALMCLAESLLRVPDPTTRDKLIRDKIGEVNWELHAGKSNSLFVNAATWGLMLTGKMVEWHELPAKNLQASLKRLTSKSGEPMIRGAVNYAMRILSQEFVMGETIEAALKQAQKPQARGYRYSYDRLGEAARTKADAKRYYQAYVDAIKAIGEVAEGEGPIERPGISVKLSALHPRYEFRQQACIIDSLSAQLLQLSLLAKHYQLGLTVDAEEAANLMLSLTIFERVFADPSLEDWQGLGLAVQSYQKRALPVLQWLASLARRHQRRIMVRLIKGAYWDMEIKESQVQGYAGYPVFTRKIATDVSFLACAKFILNNVKAFYPQFATHNAYSAAAVLEMAGHYRDFEFQCLHGMGFSLYDEIVGEEHLGIPCRIYAPVGGYEDLLAYLVRRLLENGANTSFVNRIVNKTIPINDLIQDPVAQLQLIESKPHPNIPLPSALYGVARKNSAGFDFSNSAQWEQLQQAMAPWLTQPWRSGPLVGGVLSLELGHPLFEPRDHGRIVGYVTESAPQLVEEALVRAQMAQSEWDRQPVRARADCLLTMADLLEKNHAQIMQLLVREAGKTLEDAWGELREAVDYCRYYAQLAIDLMAKPTAMSGPTGERNELHLQGRGVMVCISPWNFPLAIFLGQISAALVTGNTVLAKPAEQTPLMACLVVQLLHQAGVPTDVVQLLPGAGEVVGKQLVRDLRVAGVIFTGSTQTARAIHQTLANREGSIPALIAETGGQNAMIVDSTALLEQVVVDVIKSAFGSAGQRCSALRVLFIQEDVASDLITMLQGAMAELQIGDPGELTTDVGPIIDKEAKANLEAHRIVMASESKLIYQVALPEHAEKGTYFAPIAVEISALSQLEGEVFGPFLHVIRYPATAIDAVIAAINQTGYGLTLGIHSRIDEFVSYICERAHVGNTYVNRSMTGAVVGVQPFGGEGLSGTGPKAGGPHYLTRLCVERTVTINTTAASGNASLMSLAQ